MAFERTMVGVNVFLPPLLPTLTHFIMQASCVCQRLPTPNRKSLTFPNPPPPPHTHTPHPPKTGLPYRAMQPYRSPFVASILLLVLMMLAPMFFFGSVPGVGNVRRRNLLNWSIRGTFVRDSRRALSKWVSFSPSPIGALLNSPCMHSFPLQARPVLRTCGCWCARSQESCCCCAPLSTTFGHKAKRTSGCRWTLCWSLPSPATN